MSTPTGLILRGDTWHMRFRVKGVEVAESTHTSDLRVAERIKEKRRTELHEHLMLGGGLPIKLHDAIDQFQRSRSHLPSSVNANVHTDVFRALPNVVLHQLPDDELQELVERRFAQGYKRSTVAVTVGYFNAMLNYCANKGYLVRRKLPTIKGVKGRIRWLTDAEEAKFFAAIKSDYQARNPVTDAQRQDNYDLAKLLSHTGARFSEIANMTWDQVDFDLGTVLIKRGKGSNDSTMFMTSAMREIFARRRAMTEGDYVLEAKVGRHCETHWVQSVVRRAGLSTAGGSISLHTFRHSRAVKWLQDGLDVLEVQRMLGHKSINSTLVYLHLVPSDVARKAAAATERRSGG